MKKIGLVIIVQFVLLTACSNAQGNITSPLSDLSTPSPMNQSVSSITDVKNIQNANNTPSIAPSSTEETKSDEEKEKGILEKTKRKGELDLENIKVVGVEGSLLQTIMTYLKAVKDKDEKKRLSTIYAPDVFSDGLKRHEPYILAVKGLTLDNTRVKAVTEWFGLDKIADEVVIVSIDYSSLGINLKEGVASADYIYIRVKGKWKLYETQ
ncbi:hypothetical protein [Paenibacillus sp. LHD-38]|uniref:hypothetical protein n=1 Tax=Paenibacillus sp. LHD-38 TaxID=3072143 RepID=UPI00280D60B3|nr:hypothetical protein [Paenibacillus sp. LHD-38]MDQ8739006.1 hypothetical protein [Paenibacillus sp. LHD-38]